ncbi:MAG: metalloregulator ArsR/SmtB family transcription factor [Pseudomonadota bacterium]
MEATDGADRFAALAQATRLEVMRALVKAGPAGLAAGALAESVGVAPSNMSFHLKELANAGLALARKDGRRVIYAADYGGLRGLVDFLMAECCQGDPRLCGPYVIKESA